MHTHIERRVKDFFLVPHNHSKIGFFFVVVFFSLNVELRSRAIAGLEVRDQTRLAAEP